MSTVQQSGTVTPGHVATWTVSGVLQDGGAAATPYVNALAMYGSGGTPFTITNSSYPGSQSGSPATIGLGVNSTAGYTAINNAGTYQVIINGTTALQLTQTGTVTLGVPLGVASGGTGVTSSTGTGSTVLSNNGTLTSPVLITPSLAGTVTLGVPLGVASGGTGVTSSTGTGSTVLSNNGTLTSPVLITPSLGGVTLPASGVLLSSVTAPASNPATGTPSASTFFRGDGTWALAPGTGTVTSVQVSGGSTGLTTSGGPVNTSGTITLAGTLAVANGGTGVTTSTGSGAVVLATSPTITGDMPVSGTVAMGSSFLRNRVINGSMTIDNRNNGASGTAVNVNTVDRWKFYGSQTGKLTWGRNLNALTPFVGFPSYLGFQSSSAYAVAAGDYFHVSQTIEGRNTFDFAFGTASAKSVTLSFWAQSSLTGTFGGALSNAAGTRSYPFTYSLPTANTPTKISITFPGDTGGTWVSGGTAGSFFVHLNLGTGSTYSGTAGAWVSQNYTSATGAVSLVGTSGATFYVTGVQLEAGSVATPFEWRLDEEQLCMRYLQVSYFQWNYPASTSGQNFIGTLTLPVSMRATPTVTTANVTTVSTSFVSTTALTNTSVSFTMVLTAAGGYAGTYYLDAEVNQ